MPASELHTVCRARYLDDMMAQDPQEAALPRPDLGLGHGSLEGGNLRSLWLRRSSSSGSGDEEGTEGEKLRPWGVDNTTKGWVGGAWHACGQVR